MPYRHRQRIRARKGITIAHQLFGIASALRQAVAVEDGFGRA
jgi:hypothetical protein